MITIDRKNEDMYYVNDKLVRRDMNGNWVAPYSELNSAEAEAFNKHLRSHESTT